jgi:hypothetical protein
MPIVFSELSTKKHHLCGGFLFQTINRVCENQFESIGESQIHRKLCPYFTDLFNLVVTLCCYQGCSDADIAKTCGSHMPMKNSIM